MVILTYFVRGNPLSPLLFPISSPVSYICTFAQAGQHIPQPLMDQLWISGWNKKWPKLQMGWLSRIDKMIETFTCGHSTAWAMSCSDLPLWSVCVSNFDIRVLRNICTTLRQVTISTCLLEWPVRMTALRRAPHVRVCVQSPIESNQRFTTWILVAT